MSTSQPRVPGYLERVNASHRLLLHPALRVVRDHSAAGFEQGLRYAMIGFDVTHWLCPHGYLATLEQALPFGGVSAQKLRVCESKLPMCR